MKYLTCLQLDRPIIQGDLPLLDSGEEPPALADRVMMERPLKEAKRDVVNGFERKYLEHALCGSEGNIAAAARASGKPRRAFFELMRKHGITAADFRHPTA